MIIEKPSFPKGASAWWGNPRASLTPRQLFEVREYDRKLRALHRLDPAKKSADTAAYHRCINKDRAKVYARNAAWRKRNWPAVLEARKKPGYRIASAMRSRICKAIKTQKAIKSETMLALLGCTLAELMVHLERQFIEGMTWENYGPIWHIDHIRPCASFDLSDPEQQRACFSWKNLQPLWAKDNLVKHAKFARP